MAFDPDAFLGSTGGATATAEPPAFDPDKLLAQKPEAPQPGPNWGNLYAGLDGLDQRVNPQQAQAFKGLDRTDPDGKEARARAINKTFYESHVDGMPSGAFGGNWPAVRRTIAQELMGQPGDVSDQTLYGLTAAHLKAQDFTQNLHASSADLRDYYSKVISGFQDSFRPADENPNPQGYPAYMAKPMFSDPRSAEEKKDQETPFVALPEAKNVPNLPHMGIANPALAAGVWNSILKPVAEGLETKEGVGLLGLTGLVGGARSAGVPLAKEAMRGIEGAFSAYMGSDAVQNSPAIAQSFADPDATAQDQIEAVGNVVRPLMLGAMSALDAVAKAKPEIASQLTGNPKVDLKILGDEAMRDPADTVSMPASQKLSEAARQQAKGSGKTALPISEPTESRLSSDSRIDRLPETSGPVVTKATLSGMDTYDATIHLRFDATKELPTKDSILKAVSDAGLKAEVTELEPAEHHIISGEQGWQIRGIGEDGRQSKAVTQKIFSDVFGMSENHAAPSATESRFSFQARLKGTIDAITGKRADKPPGLMDNLPTSEPTETPASQPMGITNPAMANVAAILKSGWQAAASAASDFRSDPKYEGFNKVLNEWVGNRQLAAMKTAGEIKNIMDAVPDRLTRVGISNWIEAQGDQSLLQQWAKGSKLGARRGYEAAMSLTLEQLVVADKIKQWFNDKFSAGAAEGVIDNNSFRDNYVTHIVDQPLLGKFTGVGGGLLRKSFKYSKERVFPNFYDLEQAGFSAKTKDVAEIMARYDSEMTKSILTRRMVRDLMTTKNEAGEPLALPIKGQIREGEGEAPNFISDPMTRSKDGGDTYRAIENPALRKWWWAKTDEAGKSTFIEGEIGLHPDIRGQLENALGRSEITKWMQDDSGGPMMNVLRAGAGLLEKSQSFVKRSMLGGISTFHAVHEGERALGNGVNPFVLPEIDPDAPLTQKATRTGLMIAGDNDAVNLFSEGLGAKGGITDAIPVVRDVARAAANFTFHTVIPRLKMKTWETLYERNTSLYADKIKAGEVAPDDVAYLTSHQVNARFGHLNLADLNRDPTLQHFLRLTTLAPDFWEANVRNYGQVLKGLTGAKAGAQPAIAFAATAAAVWLTARVLNSALDGDPHNEEPFGVIAGGRRYNMRNEAEDLWRMMTQPTQYVKGRLSPMTSSAMDAITGHNWRGEKITPTDALKEFGTKIVPMSARWMPAVKQLMESTATGQGRTVTPFQEFLGSQGVQVSRHSPMNDAYKLASEWKKSQGDKEDAGVYPVSKYQQLRYALEDGDTDRAQGALKKLQDDGETLPKLIQGFRSSVTHPWTGSARRDYEFKASLPEKDLEKVEAAEEHRQRVFRDFLNLVGTKSALVSMDQNP